MKKYKKYKPTNIDWIGDIPEHWEAIKLKYLGKALIGITYSPDNVVSQEDGILVLRSSNVQEGHLAFEDCVYVDKIFDEKYFVREGDILLCARNGSAHLVGKSAYINKVDENMTFGAFMSIVRSDLKRYLFYFFNSQIFKAQTGLFSTSTINQLTSDTLNNMVISFPNDIKEQTKIANYLDKKTQEIDQLIDDKKQLQKLIEEEKTALITHAITKGLNSNAEFKNSGIEWIGDLPKHWKMMKLKHVVIDKLKYGANESAEEEILENPRYIRITDFGKNGKLKKDTFKSLPSEKAKDYLLSEGDVLFARSGATVGKTFQFKDYDGKACFAGYLIKAAPNPNIVLSDYLYLFTKTSSYEQWKNSIFNQATIQNIGADKYSILDITIPQIEEQKLIVDFIQKETKIIDSKIKKTKKLIDLLTEYRSALISDVVTGKVNVIE